MDEKNNVFLSLHNITKLYPGVVALNNVSVSFRRGEIHALIGENGAGKSTLIKVITGSIKPEKGTIEIDGRAYPGWDAADARTKGIEAVYQEYNLVDGLSAAENICLGKKYGRLVDRKKMNAVAQELFDRFQIDINPASRVGELSSAKRQIVEISKAVSKGARLLILDEPTAPLTVAETKILMNMIRIMKQAGVTIIYISHRLEEIFAIADRVSVFRDGQYVCTRDIAETSQQDLIRDMVGRELSSIHPLRKTPVGPEVLRVENLSGNGVSNISFTLHKGEILGFAGLVGSGRTEILKVLYGAEKKQYGHVYIKGQEVNIRSPRDAMRCGIGMVPEDRKREGCFLMFGINWNLTISCIEQISRMHTIDRKKDREIGDAYIESLSIKTPKRDQLVLNLSGGNQQKVVMGKTLAAGTDIIILDEPTRGIDVGSKWEIYTLMRRLCESGKSIIMVSSEMGELLGMSDRLVVFHEKKQAGTVDRAHFEQEYIMSLASGITADRQTL